MNSNLFLLLFKILKLSFNIWCQWLLSRPILILLMQILFLVLLCHLWMLLLLLFLHNILIIEIPWFLNKSHHIGLAPSSHLQVINIIWLLLIVLLWILGISTSLPLIEYWQFTEIGVANWWNVGVHASLDYIVGEGIIVGCCVELGVYFPGLQLSLTDIGINERFEHFRLWHDVRVDG